MTPLELANAYAAVRGWELVRTSPLGATFRMLDGVESLTIWGALPEELRWHEAQRDRLERMAAQARFLEAAGAKVEPARLVRELEKLGTGAGA